MKIGSTPVSLEYRKARGDADAEIRITGMLDEAARKVSASTSARQSPGQFRSG